MTTTSAGC